MKVEIDPDSAEAIALKALTFIAGDDDIFERFLLISGATPGDLKAGLANRFFLAGVLEFLLSQEALLLEFCDRETMDPRFPDLAHSILTGTDKDMNFI